MNKNKNVKVEGKLTAVGTQVFPNNSANKKPEHINAMLYIEIDHKKVSISSTDIIKIEIIKQ